MFATRTIIATYIAIQSVTRIEELGRTGGGNKRCKAMKKSIELTTMSKHVGEQKYCGRGSVTPIDRTIEDDEAGASISSGRS